MWVNTWKNPKADSQGSSVLLFWGMVSCGFIQQWVGRSECSDIH